METATTEPKSLLSYFRSSDRPFWDVYKAGRPEYPRSFYDLILDYHKQHGTDTWQLVHDIGCGSGNVAEVLAERFAHVVASDSAQAHVEAARARLNTSCRPSDVDSASFVAVPGELLADQAQAADWNGRTCMITAAECITLMDGERALACFERLLAPGGTLAIWFYGRAILLERDGSTGGPAQRAFDNLITRMFVALGGIGVPAAGHHRAGITRMVNWLEYLRFDTGSHAGKWRDVRRIQWNSDQPMCFFRPDAFLAESAVRAPMPTDQRRAEKVEMRTDRDFWASTWDEARAWLFILAMRPTFQSDLDKDAQLKREIGRLRQVLAGAMGAGLQVTWPVTLILAAKT